jgi:hypothetical protein
MAARRLRHEPGPGRPALGPVHYVEGSPASMVKSVLKLGLEGVVAKYAGSRYVGGRSALWRKLVLRRPDRGWRVEALRRRMTSKAEI